MSAAEEGRARASEAAGSQSVHDLKAGHTLLASTVLLAVAGVVAMTGRPSLATELVLLTAAVAVGLPHGALDGRDGRTVFAPRYGRLWFVPFLGSYTALSVATLMLWWLAPLIALCGFLALSLFHFGQCDRNPANRFPRVSMFAHGGIPIVLPALAFPGEVEQLFAWLVGEKDAAVIAAILAGPVAIAWLAAIVVECVQTVLKPQRHKNASEALTFFGVAASLVLLFMLVPPLIAFALYFALFHAPRALLQTAEDDDPAPLATIGHRLQEAAFLSLAAITLGVGLFLLQPTGDWSPAAVRSVFLLLSALTVPHMWLEYKLETAASAGANPCRSVRA